MLLTGREVEKLSSILECSIVDLFTTSLDDALEKINWARKRLDDVPKSLKPKVARALDVLENMVNGFYTSIAERRGPVYEATWLYILSALDPSVEWYKPILENADEALKYVPLCISYGSVGVKKLKAAINPSRVELEVFLTSINPKNPSLEIVLRENEEHVREELEYIIRTTASKVTLIEENKVTFLFNRVIDVTPDEAAKIANKLRNYLALYVLRYPWYKRLADELAKALNEETYLDIRSDSPNVAITIKLDRHFREAGLSCSGKLYIMFTSTSIRPSEIAAIVLKPSSINGAVAEDKIILERNVMLQQTDDYVKAVLDIVTRNAERATSLLEKVSSYVGELTARGYAVPKVWFANFDTPTPVYIYAKKRAELWGEDFEIRLNASGEPVIIEVTLDTKFGTIKNVIDVSEWRNLTANAVSNILSVDYFRTHRNTVQLTAEIKQPSVYSLADICDLLSNVLAATFNEYKEMEKSKKESYKVGTKEAVALLLAYYANRNAKEVFESRTSRSFGEVFMKVGSLLNRLGKPMPGTSSISNNPALAIERLMEAGIVTVSSDGHVLVDGVRVAELLPWSELVGAEQKIIGALLGTPSTLFMVLSSSPQYFSKTLATDSWVSDKVVNALLQPESEKIPLAYRIELLKSLSPPSAVRLLDAKPTWILDNAEALAALLHVAGKARASPNLTSFAVNARPDIIGGDVQTITIGDVEFIDKGGFLVLFSGLTEPTPSAKRIFEVYDRRTRRGMVVAAPSIDDAVEIAGREMQKAISEYRLIVIDMDEYESKYGVQVELSSRNTEGYTLPELVVRYFEPSGSERSVSIPLQPGIKQVFEEVVKKCSRTVHSEDKAVVLT